jgi:hypothetical protein
VHLKKVMAKLVDLKLPLLRQRLPPAFSPPAAAKAPYVAAPHAHTRTHSSLCFVLINVSSLAAWCA